MKMYRLAAYCNKHRRQVFWGYQHWLPWTTLKSKKRVLVLFSSRF